MSGIPDDALSKLIADIMKEHGGTLRSLAKGDWSTKWPCPHEAMEKDPQTGQTYCKDCWHWVKN